MPTNNRRRTIACLLRHINMTHDPNWSSVISCLGVTSREKAVLALADLIEPEERTCHMRDTSWDDGQCTWGCICSECGAKHEHERSGWMNFCPNCGARVVANE